MRCRVANLLLFGVLAGVAGCGGEDSVMVARERVTVDCLNGSCGDDGSYEEGEIFLEYRPVFPDSPSTPSDPIPTQTPTYEPPELDRSELDANLARLSPADRELADRYMNDPIGEGTWVVVSPMTVNEARLRLLGPNPQPAKQRDFMSPDSSAYSIVQVGDGVVAWESTGFADPPTRVLADLSRGGATSAVVTENIEAMTHFAYARDGKVVFDELEYAFVDDIDQIPAEVRDLARLAWDDLEGPMVETASPSDAGMAMAEKVTGVRPPTDEWNSEDWYAVPLPWGAGEGG